MYRRYDVVLQHDPGQTELLRLSDEALLGQCHVDTYRARGPGGQKRNKTSSAVRLRHESTGLTVTATEDRSQHVNKRRAARRLREAIALHVRRPVDIKTYGRSEEFLECVGPDGRILVSARDDRRFLIISEILDVLSACGMRISESAKHFSLSTARLIKLLRQDKKLWARVNQMRGDLGVKPLR